MNEWRNEEMTDWRLRSYSQSPGWLGIPRFPKTESFKWIQKTRNTRRNLKCFWYLKHTRFHSCTHWFICSTLLYDYSVLYNKLGHRDIWTITTHSNNKKQTKQRNSERNKRLWQRAKVQFKLGHSFSLYMKYNVYFEFLVWKKNVSNSLFILHHFTQA